MKNTYQIEEIAGPSSREIMFSRILGHRGLIIGAAVLCVITGMAILAPILTSHDPFTQDLSNRLVQPFWDEKGSTSHILGTDALGRDYLTRLIYGARVSLLIGFSTALGSGIIGTVLGLLSGYYGGRVDMLVTFIITTRLTLPVVLIALAVVSLVGGTLPVVVSVLSLLLWDRFAVVIRSATKQIRSKEFVSAAKAVGCSTPRILFVEILPNLVGSLVVIGSLEVGHAILLESALSFLGLGVQPPTPSWGLMVAEGKGLLFFKPWLITFPGVALALLVLSLNLIGDGIRDVTASKGIE
ncbi:MAG: ABC transporter permease [Proteobacteria bacterium]|nr:ABC transporter permease [Pseudomonadota bacterium]